MSFVSLKDLIPKAASKYQLSGELKASLVINRASALVKEIFSEEASRSIRIKYLKKNVLWVAVNNSAVAQELQMKSHTMVKSLNESFQEELVWGVRSFQETETEEG